MARGKNTTVKVILSNVRVKTGTVNDNQLTDSMLIDLLNMNVATLARRLSNVNAPIYMTSATLTLSAGAYSLTSLAIERVIKLVDSSLGLISQVLPEEYENIQLLSGVHTSSMFFTQEGESIRIFKGATLGSHGTIKLYYYEIPTFATLTSEKPDLPDSYTSLLIKMLCSDVYSYQNKGQRDAEKEKEIAGDVAGIKQSYGGR